MENIRECEVLHVAGDYYHVLMSFNRELCSMSVFEDVHTGEVDVKDQRDLTTHDFKGKGE